MSSGLLVIGMISDLSKFDEFHTKKEALFRVISTPYEQLVPQKTKATSPLLLGPELTAAVPGVEVVQLGRRLNGDARVNNKKLSVQGIYADDHFFDHFSFELLVGDAREVLKNPYAILVTEQFAERAFEDTNPVGQLLEIDGLGSFLITGIVSDPPRFSHLQFQVIGS